MALQGRRRFGLELDNLFCNTDKAREEWGRNDPALSFLKDNPFWGSLEPYEDIPELVAWLQGRDFVIMAERQKDRLPVTRGWLKSKCGLVVSKEQLIVPALMRYDCRLNGVTAFLSASPSTIENLKTETVVPVAGYLVNREEGQPLREVLERVEE